jgi:hypothetical protein
VDALIREDRSGSAWMATSNMRCRRGFMSNQKASFSKGWRSLLNDTRSASLCRGTMSKSNMCICSPSVELHLLSWNYLYFLIHPCIFGELYCLHLQGKSKLNACSLHGLLPNLEGRSSMFLPNIGKHRETCNKLYVWSKQHHPTETDVWYILYADQEAHNIYLFS